MQVNETQCSSVIFILLHIWQNYVCFGEFLGKTWTDLERFEAKTKERRIGKWSGRAEKNFFKGWKQTFRKHSFA